MKYDYKVLKDYPRPIVHMRQQLLANKKFGLVLGAGVSKHFGLPNWNELINQIAEDPEIDGLEIMNYKTGSPQASITQMLYEHFKSNEIEKRGQTGVPVTKEMESSIYKKWRNIIHTELWKGFKEDFLKQGHHPFLDPFVEIIKKSSLTINYNFDDTIQTIINDRKSPADKRNGVKLFETVWDARLQFQNNQGIIYHPNGFLPRNLIEGASENLVFSEDSFADQLIASMTGHYSTLLHHLSKNTCLFIGLSLEDNTLKHLLRQNALINPGHYHYYVAYTPDKSALKPAQKVAIRESNFELYNLITLFLNQEEIKELGELLLMGDSEFRNAATANKVSTKFIFYVTGAVGCGKTTTLQYFRNLATFSEWPEQKHPLLAKPFDQLTNDETLEVDGWINEMFFLKNLNLNNLTEGITVIDRTPLDPLTFTKDDQTEWKKKAENLNDAIGLSENSFRIVKGQVLLLKGNCEIISNRIKARQKLATKEYDSNSINVMYQKFEKVFGGIPIREITTVDLSIHEVVKKVARVIHMDAYQEHDLHGVLDELIA